jgi:hypothetical protein
MHFSEYRRGERRWQCVGVSCVAATRCFAVGSSFDGSQQRTLVEQWNGTSWAVMNSPNFFLTPNARTASWLNSVSCATTTSCVAVGQDDAAEPTVPLQDVWNGKAWHLTVSPPASTEIDIDSVSCPSAGSCLAVGAFGRAIAQRWNGTTWSLVAHPHTPGVIAVACVSIENCYGVGQTTIQHWNGTSWSIAAQA